MTPDERRGGTEWQAAGKRRPRGMEPDGGHGGAPSHQDAPDLSDEQLDAWILARLELAGVDLSVLPADDPDAPADRKRIMESARRFLRSTPPAILAFGMDVQDVPPVMYPAEVAGRTAVGGRPSED